MNDFQQAHSSSSATRKESSVSVISMEGSILVDPPISNPEEEEEDRLHLQKIITAFRFYRKHGYARLNKTEGYLNSLPKRQQQMLSQYRNHLKIIRDCIDENQNVIKKMLRDNFLNDDKPNSTDTKHLECPNVNIRVQDVEKAYSTLKVIARDWSSAGAAERDQCYKPIIDGIEEFFNPDQFNVNEVKILVPGAGLGRLTYEIGCRGYECEGNEFSYFMLIASNFVLNQCPRANMFTLYPWLHQYDNNLNMSDQVACITFPDVCPAEHPPKGKVSMAAGDFIEVYKDPNTFNCVATCFFIDCANNIVDFIETIYRILVPGGIWINLGPLLYHYSDIQGENSIEPTYENLVHVIESVGFEIIRHKTGVCTKYAQNPKSMLKSEYESLFWICRKPFNAQNESNGHDNNEDDSNDDKNNCIGIMDIHRNYSNGYN